MSLLERIFFWRPDALPLLGGIKASKHMTASSSSLLPFVRVRQCVTSDDSKNRQKMWSVAGGGGGGGVPSWLEPLANYSLPAEPHSSQGGMLLLEEFFEFPHLLSLERFFPTYSPLSSPFKRWLLVLSSLRRLTFNFLATTMPTTATAFHHLIFNLRATSSNSRLL